MKYPIIMLDIPWKDYNNYKRGRQFLTDNIPPGLLIASAPFNFLQSCLSTLSSPDHLLFVWVTEKHTQNCREYMERLGYNYDHFFVWQRPKWKGHNHSEIFEYLMVYHKGQLLQPAYPLPDSLAESLKGKVYNRKYKPEGAYQLIENLYPNQAKLQLFGRLQRPFWHIFYDNHDLLI